MIEDKATRTTTEAYRCRCILLDYNRHEISGSRCDAEVNVDTPFCADCERRHPEVDRDRVLTVPLSEGATS